MVTSLTGSSSIATSAFTYMLSSDMSTKPSPVRSMVATDAFKSLTSKSFFWKSGVNSHDALSGISIRPAERRAR